MSELVDALKREVDLPFDLVEETRVVRSIDWDREEIKSKEIQQDRGAGLRIKNGERIALAYSNGAYFDSEDLRARAMEALPLVSPDRHENLTQSTIREESSGQWYDARIEKDDSDRIDLVAKSISSLMQEQQLQSVQVNYTEQELTQNLFRDGEPVASEKVSRFSVGTWAICSDGDSVESGYESQKAWNWDDLDINQVMTTAFRRGVEQLDSVPPESWKGPVILAAPAASKLLGLVLSMLDGEAVVKNRSKWNLDQLGESVGNEQVTVVDDPFLESGANNSTYDGEGYPMSPLTLISNGQLEAFLTNQYVASKGGVQHHARASRTYSGKAGTSYTNAYLEPGNKSPEQLRSHLDTGPVVTDLQTGSGMNAVAGRFSVGAKGFLLNNGKRERAFSEATLSGEIDDLLMKITAVGDQLPRGKAVASPDILVDELSLGGQTQ